MFSLIKKDDFIGNTYDFLTINIEIKRHSGLISRNVLLPVLVIALLMFFVFLLPINLSEKIPLIINFLLIITVYQLILMQSIPSSIEMSLAENIVNFVFIFGMFICI